MSLSIFGWFRSRIRAAILEGVNDALEALEWNRRANEES